jgi:hypothetical protein
MKVKYELLLLFDWGLSPKAIINLGYKPKTVYKWSRVYKDTLTIAMTTVGVDQLKLIRKLKSLYLEQLMGKQLS